MGWFWPLKSVGRTWPDKQGQFGALRKFEIHTGVDLYCPKGTRVVAVEDGYVVAIEDFTGPKAGTSWWNDTQAILVTGVSGVVCYGEIKVEKGLTAGTKVRQGGTLGTVKQVLKKNKGRPMSMLHLELYRHYTKGSVVWKLEDQMPRDLLDPTEYLQETFFLGW